MKNPITNQILSHLEFLGYKVEDTSGTDDKDILMAKHEQKSTIVLNITKSNTVLITARYIISESTEVVTQEFFVKINKVNSQAVFTKWYYEETSEKKAAIAIETFTVDYNKQVFGSIIEVFEYEISKFFKDIQN